jgi:hypothetical protein
MPATAPQLLEAGQLALLMHDWHVPPEQNPLRQSSPATHVSLLSSLQRSPWHFPPTQSPLRSQGEPFGALHTFITHDFEGQSASAAQPAQVLLVQSLLAHSALSPQGLPFGARQKPARQVLLAHSLLSVQGLPVFVLQLLAPSHASVGSMQVPGSMSPTRTGVQVPGDPSTLQAWHVPPHVVVQQTLSTHVVLPEHSGSILQASPAHFPQAPPQSTAVSGPFLMPSEQLTHMCVAMSHVGFVPILQSVFVVQFTQAPAPSQVPFGHIVPSAAGIFVGTPATQSFSVQTLRSSIGGSFGSSWSAGFPSAPHTLFMQSFGVWVIDGSPFVSFGLQNEATQIEAVQPSCVGIPQSTSPTHGVQPGPVPQLPELAVALTLVLAVVLVSPVVVVAVAVAPLLPPAEAPLRSSVQPPDASNAALASATSVPATSARDPRADR